MHREAQRRFEQLVFRQARAEAQHHARHVTRKLARQLQPAAVDEEIDDGEGETPALEQLECLVAIANDVHDVAAAPQDGRHGMTTVEVSVHE